MKAWVLAELLMVNPEAEVVMPDGLPITKVVINENGFVLSDEPEEEKQAMTSEEEYEEACLRG